jgi:hypothetical protein
MTRKTKNLLLFFILFFVAFFILFAFQGMLETTHLHSHLLVLLLLSVILNLGVILYHYSIPPHPKFLILPARRWTIRFHVWSGTIELISGIVACFFLSPVAALIQACAALFFHIPTALLQTPIVFGSKAVMTPSYLLCIFIHGFCALQLFLNPNSQAWAINTFLIFNIYAWCRFYFYFFDKFHLFGNEKYSVSILFAGLTIIPALFGPLSILILGSFIGLYIFLVKFLFISTPEQYSNLVHERGRYALLGPEFINKNVKMSDIIYLKGESQRDKANYVFNLLDSDKDQLLSKGDLEMLLYEWGLSKGEVENYYSYLGTNNINFDLFFHKMSPIWKFVFFDILKAHDTTESSDMIRRSLESLKSTKSVSLVKKEIQISLLLSTPFLKDADIRLVEDLSESLLVKDLNKGDVLFSEGDLGDRFYLVGSGNISVFKSGEFITTLSQGACVGEMALIENRPRSATIISLDACVLYSLSKQSFDYVLSAYPHLKEDLLKLIHARKK